MLKGIGGVTISRVIDDPQAIAMAGPVRTLAASANLGDATISAATVVDRNDPNLLTNVLIEFTSPTTYTINGAGSSLGLRRAVPIASK